MGTFLLQGPAIDIRILSACAARTILTKRDDLAVILSL